MAKPLISEAAVYEIGRCRACSMAWPHRRLRLLTRFALRTWPPRGRNRAAALISCERLSRKSGTPLIFICVCQARSASAWHRQPRMMLVTARRRYFAGVGVGTARRQRTSLRRRRYRDDGAGRRRRYGRPPGASSPCGASGPPRASASGRRQCHLVKCAWQYVRRPASSAYNCLHGEEIPPRRRAGVSYGMTF